MTRLFQGVRQEIADGGFAVGAGDGDDGFGPAHILQEIRAQLQGQGAGKSVPLWRVIFSAGTDSFAIHSANRNRSLPIVFKPPW